MQESTHDEMVLPSGDQNKTDGQDSIHLESPALALKVEEHSARKRSSEIHKTLPVIHTDEISADVNIINTDETFPETLADAEKFDTSISTNNNPPAETGGIVISAYKVPMEKKSLGYVVTEEKPVQEIDGVVVKKSKRTENQEKDSEELIFTVVEQMPEYPGGQEKMLEFLSENLKYPDSAKESGIQGSVYVSFEVRKDGRISDVKVLKGIGGGCDEEAIRLVNLMPHWKPGRQNGKTVKTRFTMPVNFKLQQ
jgi:TonB family protein